MSDNNATDTTEDELRKQAHSKHGIRSSFLMVSNKDQVEVGTGNCLRKSLKKGKGG